MWFTKELAAKHNIKIDWVFTESGNGKSSCDGIGGNIKNLIRDLTVFNTSQIITNAKDIINIITGKTTIDLNYNCKNDIEEISKNIPCLGSLTGALKMHQISFDSSGIVKSHFFIYFYPIKLFRSSDHYNNRIFIKNHII